MTNKKNNKQDNLKPIKMIFNNLLLSIILFVWIILLSYTLANPFDFRFIIKYTFHLQVARALLIVSSFVSILFYGINIYYGIYFFKSKEKESALIAFTSIFLIPAIYSIALNIRKFKSSDWKALFNDWFGKDDTFIHNEEKEKKLKKVSLRFSMLMIPTLFLSVFMTDYSNIVFDWTNGQTSLQGIFFGSWSKFTIQSNLLLLIFTTSFYAKMDSKIFKNNTLLIWIMTYITITFLGYNVVLLPAEFKTSSNPLTPYEWFETILQHMLYPFLFVIYGFYIICNRFYEKNSRQSKTIMLGMIYPLIYLGFSLICPWVIAYSTYGSFTSTNPLVSNGSPSSLLYIIGFALLFVIIMSLYWFINKKTSNKETSNKENKEISDKETSDKETSDKETSNKEILDKETSNKETSNKETSNKETSNKKKK